VCESRIEHRCYAVLVVVVDRGGGGFAEGDSGAHRYVMVCMGTLSRIPIVVDVFYKMKPKLPNSGGLSVTPTDSS